MASRQPRVGSLRYNQEVRDTGQGLVLPVLIAHVGYGSLTGSSSSYLAGLGTRFKQSERKRTFSIQSAYHACACVLCLRSSPVAPAGADS